MTNKEERERERERERLTKRKIERETERYRQRKKNRQKQREREKHIERNTERQKQRDSQIDGERVRDRDREIVRERERDRERELYKIYAQAHIIQYNNRDWNNKQLTFYFKVVSISYHFQHLSPPSYIFNFPRHSTYRNTVHNSTIQIGHFESFCHYKVADDIRKKILNIDTFAPLTP